MKLASAIVSLLLGFSFIAGTIAQDIQETPDQTKIRSTIEAYVDAFNEHRADKLAATWTDECTYVDQSGRMVEGRGTIQGEYEDYFRMFPESSMEINILSMSMASEDVAIEDGVRRIHPSPDSEPYNVRYTAIHVREDDTWKVKSVRDAVAFEPSNYQHLRGLEWLVGEWVDEEKDGVVMEVSGDWSRNRNFLIRSLNSFAGEKPVISATQWIGWDPVSKSVRSWLFDSNGGYGEGTWERQGNKWMVESKTVLPNEKVVTEKHILTLVDTNSMTFESVERSIDGEPLPDVKETVSYRAQEVGQSESREQGR